jgi:hypothetical protein
MKQPYPVLQSGFVAVGPEGLTLPDPIEPTIRQSVIFKEFKSPLLNYHFSPAVTELFNNWSAKKEVLREFDFRERLLKVAFKAFGTKEFRAWLLLQLEAETLSALHKKFLLETCDYILNGTARRLSNVQWVNLLEAGPTTASVRLSPSEFLSNKDGVREYTNIPEKMVELIVRWTQHRDGFEDLLVCLYVIFGARSRQTDVVDVA